MKKFSKKISNQSGFSLVEVLIASMLISLTTLALMSAATKGIELSNKAIRQVQASLLMEEGIEAVKSIRDNSWENISGINLNTPYYLSFDTSSNTWSLMDTPSINPETPVDGIFTRTIVFKEVKRNDDDDISGTGTLDDRTKEVQVNVVWNSNSKSMNFYLSDIFN